MTDDDDIRLTAGEMARDLWADLELLRRCEGNELTEVLCDSAGAWEVALCRALAAEARVGELEAENERLKADAAGAAALRQAFNRAAETYPPQHPMPAAVQAWWRGLYDAVTSSAAGTGVLAELATLRQQNLAHAERIAAQSEALSRAAERDALKRLEAWARADDRHEAVVEFAAGWSVLLMRTSDGGDRIDRRVERHAADLGDAVRAALDEWAARHGEPKE